MKMTLSVDTIIRVLHRTLFVLCIIIICVSAGNMLIMCTREGALVKATDFNPAFEHDYASAFNGLKRLYEKQITGEGAVLITRNLFAPKSERKAVFPLRLNAIEYSPLFIMYKGYLENSAGIRIAQINWEHKTYFVKQDEVIKGWTVLSIDANKVLVSSSDGEHIMLPRNRQVFSTKPYAVFSVLASGEEVSVHVGDELEGYKILDIQEEAVILSKDSQEITVRKYGS